MKNLTGVEVEILKRQKLQVKAGWEYASVDSPYIIAFLERIDVLRGQVVDLSAQIIDLQDELKKEKDKNKDKEI